MLVSPSIGSWGSRRRRPNAALHTRRPRSSTAICAPVTSDIVQRLPGECFRLRDRDGGPVQPAKKSRLFRIRGNAERLQDHRRPSAGRSFMLKATSRFRNLSARGPPARAAGTARLRTRSGARPAGSVGPVPVTEGIAGGGRELTEILWTGQVDHGIGGIQPARLREQIVDIHPHRHLIFLLVRPSLGNRVLRPPHPSCARDTVARIALSELGRVSERIDIVKGILRRLRPHIRADGVVRRP